MDATTFLAQLWGPVMLAVGLGIFVSRRYYLRLYRNLESESLAVLIFGMVGIAAGIAQINTHNTWEGLPEVVISLLGWGLLVKGLAFSLVPGWVNRTADWEAESKLVPIAGLLIIVVGGYLSWFAFF